MSIDLYVLCARVPDGFPAAWEDVTIGALSIQPSAEWPSTGEAARLTEVAACLVLSFRASAGEDCFSVASVLNDALGGALVSEEGDILEESGRAAALSFDEVISRCHAELGAAERDAVSRSAADARRFEARAAADPRGTAEANDWSGVGAGVTSPSTAPRGSTRGYGRTRSGIYLPVTERTPARNVSAGQKKASPRPRTLEERSRAVAPGTDDAKALAAKALEAARTASGDELANALEVLARLEIIEALEQLDFAELQARCDPSLVASVQRALERTRDKAQKPQ